MRTLPMNMRILLGLCIMYYLLFWIIIRIIKFIMIDQFRRIYASLKVDNFCDYYFTCIVQHSEI